MVRGVKTVDFCIFGHVVLPVEKREHIQGYMGNIVNIIIGCQKYEKCSTTVSQVLDVFLCVFL